MLEPSAAGEEGHFWERNMTREGTDVPKAEGSLEDCEEFCIA